MDGFFVDLSAPEFQGLSSAMTFRVYVHDAIGNPSQIMDRISLNGTATVIPEPSVSLLLGGGFGLLAMRRRRVNS